MKKYNRRSYTTKSQTSIPQYTSPSPIQQSLPQKESMMSNITSSVIQGFAIGTGSQLASRGIDAIMGVRKIEVVDKVNNNCNSESDIYFNCIKSNNNDISQCKHLFELLDKCKNI
jgi:hypothetical protein